MNNKVPPELEEKIKAELEQLNRSYVEVNGKPVNPGNCYYFDTNPPHVLYNTNCPDSLKERINQIISKYILEDEGSAY
jgi:hypothetical protein